MVLRIHANGPLASAWPGAGAAGRTPAESEGPDDAAGPLKTSCVAAPDCRLSRTMLVPNHMDPITKPAARALPAKASDRLGRFLASGIAKTSANAGPLRAVFGAGAPS